MSASAIQEVGTTMQGSINAQTRRVSRFTRVINTLNETILPWPYLPLACLLTLQAGVALVTLRNSAFQDEALYLYAGRQIMISLRAGVPLIDPFPRYLSGDPYFYPLLSSILDAWGGVEAARMLSLVEMLGVTACVYWVARHLYGSESANYAAAIFAFQGSVLFLTRLATYDASCLLLLALAVVVALRSSVGRTPLIALGIGPLLTLAVLNKYAALLWVPSILAILAWQTLQKRGWRQMLVRFGVALGSLLASGRLALTVLDTSFLTGLQGSTTSRVILQEAPRAGLVREVIILGGIGLTLSLVGCLLVARGQRLLAWLLFGSALLAPAYHIYEAEPISLDKHVAYGLYFAAPLAGYAMTRIVRYGRDGRDVAAGQNWVVGLAICLIIFLTGIQQANWQYHIWSDSDEMTAIMRTLVRPAAGRYLAEDMEVARYALQDVTEDWQWTGVFWLGYTNKAHQYLTGQDAYKAAIDEGYFDVVELSYGVSVTLDHAIDHDLSSGGKYDLVAKTFHQNVYGSGYYWIWRKHVAGSSTNSGQSSVAPSAPPAQRAALLPEPSFARFTGRAPMRLSSAGQ
jgi:hypothetical protein